MFLSVKNTANMDINKHTVHQSPRGHKHWHCFLFCLVFREPTRLLKERHRVHTSSTQAHRFLSAGDFHTNHNMLLALHHGCETQRHCFHCWTERRNKNQKHKSVTSLLNTSSWVGRWLKHICGAGSTPCVGSRSVSKPNKIAVTIQHLWWIKFPIINK